MIYLFYLFFIFFRLRRWLHFFQQHEYEAKRFLSWGIKNKYYDKRGTILLFLTWLLGGWLGDWPFVAFAPLAFLEPSPYRAKKPLVFTSRAKRIFLLALVLAVALTVWLKHPLYLVIVSQALPILLIAANITLAPLEQIIQRRYKKEAQEIIKEVNPTIIGITGSYGKTSTKTILGEVLGAYAPTLITPGSVNTLMGLVRTIREELRPGIKYFVVEIGAYGRGSIKRLTKLAPPQVGIVTSIGLAHYERFSNLETTARAKAELLEALPDDGLAVLNGDDPYCRKIDGYFKGRKVFFSRKDAPEGLKLLGDHNRLNAAAALITAREMGVPEITIRGVIRQLKPVSHRLELKQQNGITIIDDAYNSNPVGFRTALEVLKGLPAKRRILVTPGMVELGAKSQEEHKKIAELIKNVCDYVVLVGRYNTQFLRENLVDYYLFQSLGQAQEFVNSLSRDGDVILYENDLPDIYDDRIKF